jgi:hypothetical protein
MGRAIQAPHVPTPPHSAAALRPGPIPGRAKTKTRALPAPARGSGRFREQRAPTWHSRAAICRLSLAFRDSKHKVNRSPLSPRTGWLLLFPNGGTRHRYRGYGTVVAIVGISITIRSTLVQLAPACRTHIVDLGLSGEVYSSVHSGGATARTASVHAGSSRCAAFRVYLCSRPAARHTHAQSRCRCGRLLARARSMCTCGGGEPDPDADVLGVSPVSVQMWHG